MPRIKNVKKTPEPQRMGRPPKHERPPTKFTLVLADRHVAFMHRLTADVRERVGATLQGAELLRAFLDGLADSGLDLTSALDLTNPQEREDRLRAFFASKLKR